MKFELALLIIITFLLPFTSQGQNSNCYESNIMLISEVDRSGISPPRPDTILIHKELIYNDLLVERKSRMKNVASKDSQWHHIDSSTWSNAFKSTFIYEENTEEIPTEVKKIIAKVFKGFFKPNNTANTDYQVSYKYEKDNFYLTLESPKGKSIWHITQIGTNKIKMQKQNEFVRNKEDKLTSIRQFIVDKPKEFEFDDYGTLIEAPDKTIITYEYDEQERIQSILTVMRNPGYNETVVENRIYK